MKSNSVVWAGLPIKSQRQTPSYIIVCDAVGDHEFWFESYPFHISDILFKLVHQRHGELQ